MVEPTGYTALDLIGFTDRGDYDSSEYYVKNDLVHDDDGNIWRVLIDDTHGVTPAEGLNYTIFIRNSSDETKRIIAPVETSPAAASHAVGTQLIYDGALYDVTTAIAANAALVVYPTSGYNIKPAATITSQLLSQKQALAKQGKAVFMPVNKSVPANTYASGDCTIFVTNKNKVVMIDSGSSHSYNNIRVKLREMGITFIDYFILTHFHADHYNNIADLIADNYITANTVSYLPRTGSTASDIEDEALVRSELALTTVETCDSSSPLDVDDLHIDFFNCDATDYAYYNTEGVAYNNYSTCCYVTFNGVVYLMTGDIESFAMSHLISNNQIHKCNVLKVPHHGIGNAPIAFYINANPDVAVVSIAYNDIESTLMDYNQIYLLNQFNVPTYACGYGEITIGMADNLYSVITQAPKTYSGNVAQFAIYVDATNTSRGDGTDADPFKYFDDAIAFVSNNFNSSQRVLINVVGDYSYTDVLKVRNMACHVIVQGDTTGGVHHLEFNNQVSIFYADISFVNCDFNFSGEAIHIDIVGSKVEFNNCVIDGSQKTGSLSNQRGISFEFSDIKFNGSSINNKGVAITANYGNVYAHQLSGTDNTYLCAGRDAKQLFSNSTIAFTSLVGYYMQQLEVKYNETEGFNSSGEFMRIKSNTGATTETLVVDVDDATYVGCQLHIWNDNGDLYIMDRFSSSMSPALKVISGGLESGQTMSITSSGHVVSITHNYGVRVFIKK